MGACFENREREMKSEAETEISWTGRLGSTEQAACQQP